MALRDWLLLGLVGTIWGCSFLFNAVLIRELGPLWVSAGRVGIAAATSWIVLLALRKSVPRRPALYLQLGLLGVFSYALPFALFPLAQAEITSGLTAIINALTPILTVIVSHFWPGGERAGFNKALGVLAGFAGAALLALPALAGDTGGNQLAGIGYGFAAITLYAVTLNVARAFRDIDPTIIATLALTGATVAALPAALVVEGVPTITRVETWAAWLAVGVFSTGLTFQIMYRLLPRIGATNFASNTFISPVVAIILGILLLDETVLPIQIGGMAVIFVGLLLIDGRLVRAWHRSRI